VVRATWLTGEAEAFVILDADAAALMARLAGDALRRGVQLDADEHVVVDRLDQLGRAATAARPSADSATGGIGVHVGDDAGVGSLPLSTPQVARRLNLSQRRVRALAAEGRLGAERIGREWRFPTTAIENYEPNGSHHEYDLTRTIICTTSASVG
jgi:excisionase family DNA binding protein